MRHLIGLLLLLVALLLPARAALAACSPSTATIGAHGSATKEVMCRGETTCYANGCYGRCGPACNWTVLGNTYTAACTNHDHCIETYMCASPPASSATAQANCVGLLPAAIGSFGNAAWYNGVNWIQDTATSVWTSIRRFF